MSNFERAMRDPKSLYEFPRDVLADESLTKAEKIEVLKQWGVDAHLLSVAEEENMPSDSGDAPNMLNRIKRCLAKLGVEEHDDSPAK
jgi:hypothetical protein